MFEMLNANGNQLGEVGCELLQAEMDLANQGHKLDELDEDNEPDDDDDEEDEDDDEMDNGITFDEFKLKPSYRNYTQLGKGTYYPAHFHGYCKRVVTAGPSFDS